MATVAIIAARESSERVPQKNFKPFCGGDSLLEIKIDQLKQVRGLDEIIVNSESDQILEQAKARGALTQKRDPYFSTSEVPAWEMYLDIARKNTLADYIFFVVSTFPFVTAPMLQHVLNQRQHLESSSFRSVNTVTPVKGLVWKGMVEPLNYDHQSQISGAHQTKKLFEVNFAANLIQPDSMIEMRNPVSAVPLFVPLTEREAIDVDTPQDWEIAEYFYRTRKASISLER